MFAGGGHCQYHTKSAISWYRMLLASAHLSGKEGEFVAVLDSCNPVHFFHVRCRLELRSL